MKKISFKKGVFLSNFVIKGFLVMFGLIMFLFVVDTVQNIMNKLDYRQSEADYAIIDNNGIIYDASSYELTTDRVKFVGNRLGDNKTQEIIINGNFKIIKKLKNK